MLSFVYAVLCVPSFNILSVFFLSFTQFGCSSHALFKFDKFRDTTPSKLIKRENLAKAKNGTSRLKTTRLCTHIIYERQRANSTKTFTGKSKQYRLKRFILKWPTSVSGHLLVPRGEGGRLMFIQMFELGLSVINQSRRYTKISLKDTYRLLRALLGRLTNDDGGVNENGKKAIGFGK